MPGLRHGVDDRAGCASPLRVELVRQNLHFCDRLVGRARLAADVRSALVVGVVRAVEHDVVGRGRLAVGLEAVVQELAARNEHGAGRVADERHVVAIRRRQIVELLGRDVAADLRRRDVDERRFTGDRQRFGEAAHFHRQIQRGRLSDDERDSPAVQRLEAFELRGDAVPSGHELRSEVAALGAADELAHRTRIFVRDDDVHARQDATLGVNDSSAEFRRALLRQCRRGCARTRIQSEQPKCQSSHLPLQVETCRRLNASRPSGSPPKNTDLKTHDAPAQLEVQAISGGKNRPDRETSFSDLDPSGWKNTKGKPEDGATERGVAGIS